MDKGFTARFQKGLFTFYIEQDNQNLIKSIFKPADSLSNIREETNLSSTSVRQDGRIFCNHQSLRNNAKGASLNDAASNIPSNVSVQPKTHFSQTIAQKSISRGFRTNFVIKQNKKLLKSQQRPQLRLQLQADQNQQVINSRNLHGVALANIFKPKSVVLSRQNPTGRENYKMSTITYRSIRLKSQNLHHSQPSVAQQKSSQNLNKSQNLNFVNTLKRAQKKHKYFKNIKLARFDSSLYGEDQQASTQNSERSQRYLTSWNSFTENREHPRRFCRSSTFEPL